MAEVIRLVYRTGEALCCYCGHTWRALCGPLKPGDPPGKLECPRCSRSAGVIDAEDD